METVASIYAHSMDPDAQDKADDALQPLQLWKSEENATAANAARTNSYDSEGNRLETDASLCLPARALNFSAAWVAHNNLGGQGPNDDDEQKLTFAGITIAAGAVVDLVITSTSPYNAHNSSHNGLHGPFGLVNVNVNSSVGLHFRFVEHDSGRPARMEPFLFTVFDLDAGSGHESFEKLTVDGFSSYTVAEDSDISVERLGQGRVSFASKTRGGKIDNPKAPGSLSESQEARSVTLSFPATSSFTMEFEESKYVMDQGRNLMFSGPSSLVCESDRSCIGYRCPEGFHRRQAAEFLVCSGSSCGPSDKQTCCFPTGTSASFLDPFPPAQHFK